MTRADPHPYPVAVCCTRWPVLPTHPIGKCRKCGQVPVVERKEAP